MRIAVIGSNDLGKLVAHHAVSDGKHELIGFFDNRKPKGTVIEGFGEIIGTVDEVETEARSGNIEGLMIGVGYTQFDFRKEVFERFRGTIAMPSFVHSSSYVDPTARLGEAVVVLPGSTIDCGAEIGDNVLVNAGSNLAHHAVVKSHCFLAPSVAIAGYSVVGEKSFVGINATIVDNTIVGPCSRIGAGAVVTKNVTSSAWQLGVPAKSYDLKNNRI